MRLKPLLQVSTPHPVSNIRLLRLDAATASLGSADDVAFLRRRIAAQERHHEFWAANNADFQAQKAAFEQQIAAESGRAASAHELSAFYRQYLERSRARHAAYNRALWRESAAMLAPGVRLELRAAARAATELLADARYAARCAIRRALAALSVSDGMYRAQGVSVR
ncbi:hypothetical protein HK105_203231 [Polyrhizophydium stewartii]|uniref:Uncharacterized protein n=1 Tax=Polyrhizophydium stewartii TaxID=2732419 RepID=A0ABR4NCA6_9FUNG